MNSLTECLALADKALAKALEYSSADVANTINNFGETKHSHGLMLLSERHAEIRSSWIILAVARQKMSAVTTGGISNAA